VRRKNGTREQVWSLMVFRVICFTATDERCTFSPLPQALSHKSAAMYVLLILSYATWMSRNSPPSQTRRAAKGGKAILRWNDINRSNDAISCV
jgi:hypothetical protein